MLFKERLSTFIERERNKQGFYKQLIDENFLLLGFVCQYQQLSLNEVLECILFNVYKDTSKLESVDINYESTLTIEQQYVLVAFSYYLNETNIVFQRRKYIVNILERLYLIRNYCTKNYKLELPYIFYVLGNGFTIIWSESLKANMRRYSDTLKKSLPFLSNSDKTFLMEYTDHVGRFVSGTVNYSTYAELLNKYYDLYVHPELSTLTN